ncbi:putative PA domain-containing protein [Helianthus annuus]|nr:putative PA domain-containing protein [Helianthus annuus]KAJ0707814.1 putative PA domain-containing protein [Helianthus annuus]KAJ0711787.1 putative PA domain-containing protein [Helianthus annuus]
MLNRWIFSCFFCFTASCVFANVLLLGNNLTLSFEDIEANFAPPVKGSGECGTLFLAEPLDACAPLTNKLIKESETQPFVLIVRGVCSFEDKVRRAQVAGFKAAIIYNNDDSDLVASMILSLFAFLHYYRVYCLLSEMVVVDELG